MDDFQRLVYDYYLENGRALPWRFESDPYRVYVSEIMLQQTQVERVLSRYEGFITRFPDPTSLACAPLDAVLQEWKGLGYNRRALHIRHAAAQMVDSFGGQVPAKVGDLETLPGVGRATACAIAAFAYGTPVVFLETNIRTVFIHFFFRDGETVGDAELLPLVERTLDRDDPRNWYYALMDYGTMLKRQGIKEHRRSAGYRKQSPFIGSDRQIRGKILKTLVKSEGFTVEALIPYLCAPEERVLKNLRDLQQEGFLRESKGMYSISRDGEE
jgi:A/G-specific adenine glycosylase